MPRIIVFDVNETLLNVQTLGPHFEHMFGDRAVLKEWFSSVLLYSQTLTLSGEYFDFSSIADAALDMTAAARAFSISAGDKQAVLDGLLKLPAYDEVKPALQRLRHAGLRLVVLTNSSQKAVEQQMQNSGLADLFEHKFSVESVKRYKPAPEPYQFVAQQMGCPTSNLRMVAAHGWDILGATRAGCAGAFVSRTGKALLPIVAAPDVIGPDLMAVAEQLIARESA